MEVGIWLGHLNDDMLRREVEANKHETSVVILYASPFVICLVNLSKTEQSLFCTRTGS